VLELKKVIQVLELYQIMLQQGKRIKIKNFSAYHLIEVDKLSAPVGYCIRVASPR
jgi:hypothetical protein